MGDQTGLPGRAGSGDGSGVNCGAGSSIDLTGPSAAEEPGRRRRRGGRPASYYGVPPIHKAHWNWLIVWYFFLGGVSAGCYVIASVAELFGQRSDRAAVRVGRLLAFVLALPCPVLLTLDLGRPERVLHMFRVLKLRSPMSLGTWGLLAYGGFASLSAAIEAARAGWLGAPCGLVGLVGRLPARPIGLVGSGFGFFVGGYTGVLLGATAVPFWARNARLLGPLFLASALGAACGAISAILALGRQTDRATLARLRQAELIAAAGEVAALVAIGAGSGRLAAPLLEGPAGRIHAIGSIGVGLLLPGLLHAVGPRLGLSHRAVALASGVGSLLGSLALKYCVVRAGAISADDPAATFSFTGGTVPMARRGATAAPVRPRS